MDSTEKKIEQLEYELDDYYQKLISDYYKELFHREPTESESITWKNQLKSHNSSPEHLYKRLQSYPEFYKKKKQVAPPPELNSFETTVDELYKKILQRSADKVGLAHFSNLLKLGTITQNDLEQQLLDSEEYQLLKENTLTEKFSTTYSSNEINDMIKSVPEWYHTFKFGDVVTPNARTDTKFQNWISKNIPLNLKNKRVLDIGKADGYYSFLCEQRGAEKVVALDFSPDLFPGFNMAKKILNSKVEYLNFAVEQLHEVKEQFDIVLFLGVYYHLVNPMLALQKIFRKVTDSVFLSGPILDTDEPLMAYYDPGELHPIDDSNWWVASPSCLIQAAKRIGFNDAIMIDSKSVWKNRDDDPFIKNEIKNTIRYTGKIGLFKFSK